ncbi:MAG TPA: response regulator [Burkholderiaceae bacterium]
MQQAASPFRILHLEDSEPDHDLVVFALQREGFPATVTWVDNFTDFDEQLTAARFDAVLVDFNLPDCDSLDALRMVKARHPTTPIIIVSGAIGETAAINVLHEGASDYVLKDGLHRLRPALQRAIETKQYMLDKELSDARLRESQQRIAELARHLQTSIEAERTTIAREIHDEIGSVLTALKFDLSWISRHAGEEVVVNRALASLETIDQAIQSTQRIMLNLRPAVLDQGLVHAIEWLARGFEKRTGIKTVFHTTQPQISLPDDVQQVAYRTAQEALNNVFKHADATEVTLYMTPDTGVLSLEISDNGKGLQDADLAKPKSFGIRGLHERAQTVGGWVDVTTSSQGTAVILSVPLLANEASQVSAGGAA